MKKVFSSLRKVARDPSSENKKTAPGSSTNSDAAVGGEDGTMASRSAAPPVRPPRTTSLRENRLQEIHEAEFLNSGGPTSSQENSTADHHERHKNDAHGTEPAKQTSLRRNLEVVPHQKQAQKKAVQQTNKSPGTAAAPMLQSQLIVAHQQPHTLADAQRPASARRQKANDDAHMPREGGSTSQRAPSAAPECAICKESGKARWQAIQCGHAFHTQWWVLGCFPRLWCVWYAASMKTSARGCRIFWSRNMRICLKNMRICLRFLQRCGAYKQSCMSSHIALNKEITCLCERVCRNLYARVHLCTSA
jgi:hypothetical protein